MNDLSVVYIFVAQLLIGLMLGAILLVAWKTVDQKAHALTWSIAFFTSTINGVLNALNGHFSSREIYWLIVSALSLCVVALAYLGFRQRAGLPPRVRLIVGSALCAETLIAWFTIGRHHMGLRMVIGPYFSAVAMFGCALVLLQVPRKLRAAERGTFLILILFALSQLASGTAALLQGSEPDPFYLGLYQQISFLTQPACYAGLGLFVVFLLADDLSHRMRTLAVTDQLTGSMNRRGFEDAGAKEIARSRRQEVPLCVVMADIDHFKALNDHRGHAAGDQALRTLVKCIAGGLRVNDILGRVGGEEFAVLLPSTALEEGKATAERLRRLIEEANPEGPAGPLGLTCSFGITTVAASDLSIAEALSRADQALYKAKKLGRNRVEVWHQSIG